MLYHYAICMHSVYTQKLEIKKRNNQKVQELKHNDSQVTVLLESFMIMNL